jgi:hypothetical protein
MSRLDPDAMDDDPDLFVDSGQRRPRRVNRLLRK